ncbi:hypothetical protein EC991_008417 [Linnemannia zychae]|nr:hypothetical protein EC991_008417 [Linnemannia zychae]
MSLDLTLPWTANAPAWTELDKGPLNSAFPATFSSDEQTLYTFHIDRSNSPLQYNVQNNNWQQSPVKFENAALDGISAVTDPESGLIYLAGGYVEANYGAPFLKFLSIYDPIYQCIKTDRLPEPTEAFPIRRYYGNVWSKYRKSIVYWGGANQSVLDPGVVQNGVTEFSPDANAWSTMTTHGPTPEVKKFHCMAANENGTKMAIYGGQYANGTVVGELWVLDLITSTWTQGPTGQTRKQAVCTIAGEQLLIWGGMVDQRTSGSSEVIVYNFNTSTYVKQYTPPWFYKDLKPPPPPTRTKSSCAAENPTGSRGAIIGGIIGGLVMLMVIVVGVIVFRRRQRQRLHKAQFGSRHKGNSYYGGSARLFERWRGAGGGNEATGDRQEDDEDEVLEQTLKELEQEQQELDKQRRFLEQQHQQETTPRSSSSLEVRGPKAQVSDRAEIFPIPPLPPRYSSNSKLSAPQSTENLSDRRTVQAYYGHVGRHDESDGDVGVETRRQSELTQDKIEPLYGPGPEVNSAIPDLIYVPPPGLIQTTPQQGNHPHAVIDAIVGQDNSK